MNHLNLFLKKYRFNFCIFALLLFGVLLGYMEFFSSDAFLVSADGFVTEVSLMSFIKESLRNGEFPLWNKYLSAGMPMAGNISMRIFYLPNYILACLPLNQAVYWEYIIHVSVGAMFFSCC